MCWCLVTCGLVDRACLTKREGLSTVAAQVRFPKTRVECVNIKLNESVLLPRYCPRDTDRVQRDTG